MKLDLGILVGPESKQWLVDLTKQLDRLEKYAAYLESEEKVQLPKKAKPELPEIEADEIVEEEVSEEATEVEEDDDFAPAKKSAKKAAAAAFDDDTDEEVSEESREDSEAGEDVEEEDDFKAAPAPKKKAVAKAKKFTVDDCSDAAKALAKSIGGTKGREAVLKIMKKKFKTESIMALKPEQYSDFISAMEISQ